MALCLPGRPGGATTRCASSCPTGPRAPRSSASSLRSRSPTSRRASRAPPDGIACPAPTCSFRMPTEMQRAMRARGNGRSKRSPELSTSTWLWLPQPWRTFSSGSPTEGADYGSPHGDELSRCEHDHAVQLARELSGREVALEDAMLRTIEQPPELPRFLVEPRNSLTLGLFKGLPRGRVVLGRPASVVLLHSRVLPPVSRCGIGWTQAWTGASVASRPPRNRDS